MTSQHKTQRVFPANLVRVPGNVNCARSALGVRKQSSERDILAEKKEWKEGSLRNHRVYQKESTDATARVP